MNPYFLNANLTFLNLHTGIFSPVTISPASEEFPEGRAKEITCTAAYTCPEHAPTLTWNYGSMPASTYTIDSGHHKWTTVSKLIFTASTDDHGRSLTCYASFSGLWRQQVSINLQVYGEYTVISVDSQPCCPLRGLITPTNTYFSNFLFLLLLWRLTSSYFLTVQQISTLFICFSSDIVLSLWSPGCMVPVFASTQWLKRNNQLD